MSNYKNKRLLISGGPALACDIVKKSKRKKYIYNSDRLV